MVGHFDDNNLKTSIDFSTPIRRRCPNSPRTSQSWKRGLDKYRPITQLLLSPVKQISCILSPLDDDQYMNGFVWILSMSEQFFYENSMNLLISNINIDEGIGDILMNNIRSVNLDYIMNSWEDVELLGSGSFGSVYKVYDKITQEYVAVKYLKKLNENAKFIENSKKILEYLKERYYLMQAYSSPSVIKFKYSFQLNNINGLFLATDYCVCDLHHFLNILKLKSKIDLGELLIAHKYNKPSTLDDLHNKMSAVIQFDIQKLIIVLIFELFCILDFLGKCNIVHRDFKPENVMIAANGHLKLGDFGLVNNTRFIYNKAMHYLVKNNEIKNCIYKPSLCGTFAYMEMEAHFIKLKNSPLLDKLEKEPGYSRPRIDILMYAMDYLSDLWAVGVMIADFLFLGRTFTDPTNFGRYHTNAFKLDGKSLYYDYAKVLFIKKNYETYFIKSFQSLTHGKLKEIVELLPKIFVLKQGRLNNYTKPIDLKLEERKFTTEIIDMDKIASMEIFKSLNITINSVKFYEFPQKYLEIITAISEIKRSDNKTKLTVESWIKQLENDSKTSKKMFVIEPGCSMKYN